MKNPRTTIFGAIAAAAVALGALGDMPQPIHLAAIAVGAVAGALFAFFAQDAEPAPTIKATGFLLTIFLAVTLATLGCTVAHFGFAASSPAWGDLGLDIGGGTIGNASQTITTTSNRTRISESSGITPATHPAAAAATNNVTK